VRTSINKHFIKYLSKFINAIDDKSKKINYPASTVVAMATTAAATTAQKIALKFIVEDDNKIHVSPVVNSGSFIASVATACVGHLTRTCNARERTWSPKGISRHFGQQFMTTRNERSSFVDTN